MKEYLDNAYYPDKKDFARLRDMVDKHRAIYDKAFKKARNKCIAHREKFKPEDVSAVFGRGTVRDLYRVTNFLLQLYKVLFGLYENGHRPSFKAARFSVASMFRKPANGSSAPETIVREIKQLMHSIENAQSW